MVGHPDAHGHPAGSGRRSESADGAEVGSGSERSARRAAPLERLRAVWLALPRERRLTVLAAFGLILTLFLPWYQETVIARTTTANLSTISASLTGWGAFSFVEAALLLIAAAVLVLLFVRAEGAAFHVPGGDGGVITAAGIWACLLIAWRMFDKQGTTGHGLYTTASGIEWGIFVALGVAAALTYSGSRIKRANEPEPPLPGERVMPAPAGAGSEVAPRPLRGPRRPHRGLDFSELEQIKFDEPPEAPTVRRREPEPETLPEDHLTVRLDQPD